MTNKRTIFTPISIESAVEHLKQGHAKELYFLNPKTGQLNRLATTKIDFMDCLDFEWFFKSYMN